MTLSQLYESFAQISSLANTLRIQQFAQSLAMGVVTRELVQLNERMGICITLSLEVKWINCPTRADIALEMVYEWLQIWAKWKQKSLQSFRVLLSGRIRLRPVINALPSSLL